jgi:plasmid replication initiation protein
VASPLLVEIVAYAPTAFYHCTHCEVAWREMGMDNRIHEEQTENSLPPDLAQDYQRLSDWVREIFRAHCDQVVVKVIDAASVEGFFKTLRYRIRRYPAVIIDGESRTGGQTFEEASQVIAHRLEELATPAQAL